MQRQTFLTLILSLLLVGTGFTLGQYYTITKGIPGLDALPFLSAKQEQPSELQEESQELKDLSISNGYQQDVQRERQLIVPEELGKLRLSRLVEGEEALKESFRFLGGSELINKVTIPYYVSGNSQVIVWIIETYTSEEAIRILERMDDRLQDSDVFYNHDTLTFEGFAVNTIEGLNMHNYYYRRGNKVFWASIMSEEPGEIILLLLQYF